MVMAQLANQTLMGKRSVTDNAAFFIIIRCLSISSLLCFFGTFWYKTKEKKNILMLVKFEESMSI
jgi:hypothetical protein